MLIGDSGRFAIEFCVEHDETSWLFGKFAYLIGGARLGNYDNGASLNVAFASLKHLADFSGQRFAPELIHAPAAEVFGTIDRALYTGDDDALENLDFAWEKYKVYHAAPPGFDVFDYWKCYLIEDETIGRLIWARIGLARGECGEVHEQRLRSGEFDSVVESFLKHMRSQYANQLGLVAYG